LKRLKPFSYFEPATIAEAIEILTEKGGGAYPLAGGTDLLVRMKKGEIKPSTLVNLKGIPGLAQVEKEPEKGLHIGALAKISDIEHSFWARSDYPLLAEAAGLLGSPAIRNLGTLGGNIGRASPASDMVPSLIVLRARVFVQGSREKRELDVESFFKGPGSTILAFGEIIPSVLLPSVAPQSGAAYLKLGIREGMECALAGVAAFLTLSGRDHEVQDARVALAAVAPIPMRAKRAEGVLLSGSLSKERIREAARVAAEESNPVSDMRASASYRKEMVKVLASRALEMALQRAQGRRG
jgi:CO/xanthine dehydrogenase FAD-binding subunit